MPPKNVTFVRRSLPLLTSAVFGLMVAGVADAQEATLTVGGSNEVWLGQIGDENVLVIDQRGRGNVVGDNRDAFLLRQDGQGNEVDIEQAGAGNSVGRTRGLPVSGFTQSGGGNMADIRQVGALSIGNNVLGGLVQQSGRRQIDANRFELVQRGEDRPFGGEGNVVGTVAQERTSTGGSNSVAVLQGGRRNRLDAIRQQGADNRITATQSGEDHDISSLSQDGLANEMDLQLDAGDGNVAGRLLQRGTANRVAATVSGSRNRVDRVEQDNAGLEGAGNLATLAINGDDNGSAGFAAAPATFSSVGDPLRSALDDVGAVQAELTQIGIGNAIALTIVGSANLYGVFQDGDGNVLNSLQTGRLNQVASTQIGDGNTLDVIQVTDPLADPLEEVRGNAMQAFFEGENNQGRMTQSGIRNEAAHFVTGDANRSEVDQTGSRNSARVEVRGSRNNAAPFGLSGRLAVSGLVAGRIEQAGDANDVQAFVSGDGNAYAVRQLGTANLATFSVSGSKNAILIDQLGTGNRADATQIGTGNVTNISQ